MVFAHALLVGPAHANLLLLVILPLLLWRLGFGTFPLYRLQAVFMKKLRRPGYPAQAQLYSGIAIGLCAQFGHLPVGD
jgi:hypothetical protein